MRILAKDGGSPAQTATTTVKVEMLRNFQAPRFEPRDYRVTILETQGLGVSIVQVNARDDDTKVHFEFRHYYLIRYTYNNNNPKTWKKIFINIIQ